jgi:hypothetical protein
VQPTLFNIDALFELICGLIFLFNPLLGPSLPVSSGLISALGVVLLVATIFLGQAGMGKGPLFARLSLVAAVNLLSGLGLVAWTTVDDSFTSTARVFVRVVAAFLVALGAAQFTFGRRAPKARPNRSTQAQRLEAIRRNQKH